MTEMITYNLGNLDMRTVEIQKCADCGSRNVIKTKGEPEKEAVAVFVRSRISRLGLNIENYDIHVNEENGAVTATEKTPRELEIDFT